MSRVFCLAEDALAGQDQHSQAEKGSGHGADPEDNGISGLGVGGVNRGEDFEGDYEQQILEILETW